jgi:hypothetical protein
MPTRILYFGESVDVPGNEIDVDFSVTNNHNSEIGSYGMWIGNAPPTQYTIAAATSDNHTIPANTGVKIYNAGPKSLEVDW